MKITRVETIRLEEFTNLLWVRIHTDSGSVGLGETFFGARAAEAYIHETAAPALIGRDPLQIERIARDLTPYIGFIGTGAETRGRSAIDIALWDLWGRATEQPVYQLLGGLTHDRMRIYNTCAGYRYVRSRPNWGLDDWGTGGNAEGPYEDLEAFLNDAGALAESLLAEGITGMKIWPFDFAAKASGGYYISNADLDKALEPFRQIRDAVGDKMDIMVELHSLWRFPAAIKIAEALEEFDPFWYEDPIRMDSIEAVAEFAGATNVPVCASETLGARYEHKQILEAGAAGIIMPDLSWCGGITEAKKIASLAETYHRPIAPHDCSGPVALMACIHLCLNVPNALIQETVRAFYTGWYKELVTVLPKIEDGHVYPPEGPGLGTDILPQVFERPDIQVTATEAD
ncbi:MAG: mandelate racemase/muconate lactonizing enzyme family protein [Alphaproteobacteria bacterium]|jgi:L-alanine-DL-glutamate epimerase-like enolase superfamily enzyme|nr:mandelate racemase/muconate lactonizing enzyme family protein [Alphaproteobacteria bacterium]MDP6817613.1 mandelate racemase/muconate lactonizing enzyme family protein [Alphaproteobacteria bacterium]